MIELVGSRRVVPHLVGEDTDFDYIAEDTVEVQHWLKSNGWKVCPNSYETLSYGDFATTAIYRDADDNQCTLKSAKFWPAVQRFWAHMDKNPEVFISQYWKSSPEVKNMPQNEQLKFRAQILARVNFFLANC